MQYLCCDGLTRAQRSGCDSVAPQSRGRSTHGLLEARGWSHLEPQTWDLAGPCQSQGPRLGAPAREADSADQVLKLCLAKHVAGSLAWQASAGVRIMDCAVVNILLRRNSHQQLSLAVCHKECATATTFKLTYIQRAVHTSLQVGRPSSAATSETSRIKNLHAEGAPLPLSNWHASSTPSWPAWRALCCPLSRGLFLVSSFTAWTQALRGLRYSWQVAGRSHGPGGPLVPPQEGPVPCQPIRCMGAPTMYSTEAYTHHLAGFVVWF